MSVGCTAAPCPVVLDSTCVFYSGGNLIYTGINTNDNLQTALIKINNKFRDAGLGYIFQNGIVQSAPGQPVKLGGSLVQNTLITSGGFTFGLTGTIEASAFITTGGTSSQFVKGDGSLDSTSYQPTGNYITALTGDGTASGPGSSVLTLANVLLAPGTFGSSSIVPVITVNAKGLVTNVTTTPINYPTQSIAFSGDVYGAGYTGSSTVLTISNVNPNVYSTNSVLKFAVNNKGLITSAAPITNLDIDAIYGYTPIGDAPFNGTIYGRKNHAWVAVTAGGGTVTSVGVTSGTGISASVANPTTTPVITITNTAPDQTVVLNNGTGISVTGTYPNFTISATSVGSVTAVSATSPLTSSGGSTPDISTSVSGSKLIGRYSSTTGVMQEITLGTGLSFSGNTLNASAAVTPAALTKTDDTNVTLTLGGTPNTALLQAVSLTLGWTGTLADSRIASASTWNGKQNALNGTGFVKASGTTISYDNSTYTPTSRNLTINGTTYDLSADRTWTITAGTGTVTSVGAGTGMSFTSITTSGNVSIDTAKVPYYSSTPSNGLLKYTSGTWGIDTSTYLTSAITSLNGLTGATQTFGNDTNVTIVSSGTTHTITWSGTLADSRIASATTWNSKQAGSTNLTSLSALTYASTSFVKMTGAGTFALDTNTYLTSVGTGVANELTYWSGTNTLGSLSTATYPSLTELSYVKGVTSAIQTQLNGKQATLTNPVTGTGTNNEIAYFNTTGSTVASLSTATYPSLTELSYVKGVTSSIQTQINTIVANAIITNRQTSSYVLALTDAGLLVEMNVGTANNLTVPPSGTVNFTTGTQIQISQYGAGQTTVVAGLGVTIRSAGSRLKLNQQYSGATLIKIATDEWYLFGDLAL